ncbi:MAG: thioredoxin [Maribacter arcticus]
MKLSTVDELRYDIRQVRYLRNYLLLITKKHHMKKSFKKNINSEIPSLVHFYANWCTPCKLMTPILEQIEEEMGESLNVVEIDVEAKKKLSRRYKIKSLPTLLLFKNGEPLWRQSGMIQKNDIKKAIIEFA